MVHGAEGVGQKAEGRGQRKKAGKVKPKRLKAENSSGLRQLEAENG